MNRLLLAVPLALTLAGVACFSTEDSSAVPPSEKTKSTKDATEDKKATTTPTGACPNYEDEDGVTSYGCCLPTGRCGYFVKKLNACVEGSQIGADESDAKCTYTGDDDDDESEDEDKDKDDDKDDDKDKDDDAKDDDDEVVISDAGPG